MVLFPKLFSGLWPLVKAFNGLTRRIQTTVEHMRVTNATDTDFVRGEVLALTSGQRQAIRAQADAEATSWWAAVATEPTPDGETGIARINGYAYVLFEDGLDPAPDAGDEVYVSAATAGRATNAAPVGPEEFVQKIGVVGDDTIYATEGAAWVFLQHCCPPSQVDR